MESHAKVIIRVLPCRNETIRLAKQSSSSKLKNEYFLLRQTSQTQAKVCKEGTARYNGGHLGQKVAGSNPCAG